MNKGCIITLAIAWAFFFIGAIFGLKSMYIITPIIAIALFFLYKLTKDDKVTSLSGKDTIILGCVIIAIIFLLVFIGSKWFEKDQYHPLQQKIEMGMSPY